MTSTQKALRDQFEVHYVDRMVANCGEGVRSAVIAMLAQRDATGDYLGVVESAAWWAWQESRQEVVVQLPDTVANTGTITSTAVLGYKRECKEAIEAQGLRVGGLS